MRNSARDVSLGSIATEPPSPTRTLMSASPRSDRDRAAAQYVAKGHVCTAPGWQRAGRNVRSAIASLSALSGKALVERTKIDHNSLVRPAADLLVAVACRHLEVNSFPLHVDNLGRRAYLAAYRRGGEMFYIHCSANRAFTFVQKRSDSVKRSIFHDQNHHRGREHLRQYGVLKSVGKMFGLHPQCRCSSRSQWNLAHFLSLILRRPPRSRPYHKTRYRRLEFGHSGLSQSVPPLFDFRFYRKATAIRLLRLQAAVTLVAP
jgi:hypothetical protein